VFLVVSAMTEAGLNTVNLSMMSTGQQFILWFLIGIVSFGLVFFFGSCIGWVKSKGWGGRKGGQEWQNGRKYRSGLILE
jgi:hypothetical protein